MHGPYGMLSSPPTLWGRCECTQGQVEGAWPWHRRVHALALCRGEWAHGCGASPTCVRSADTCIGSRSPDTRDALCSESASGVRLAAALRRVHRGMGRHFAAYSLAFVLERRSFSTAFTRADAKLAAQIARDTAARCASEKRLACVGLDHGAVARP